MEDRHRMAMERMSEHLSRADSELEATQHFLNPRTPDEAELETWYVLWPTPGFWWGTSWRQPRRYWRTLEEASSILDRTRK